MAGRALRRWSGDQRVADALRHSAHLDAVTGRPSDLSLQHESVVRDAIFSPDGRRIVTVSVGPSNIARVWNAVTGQPINQALPLQGNVRVAALSPDGRRVVTASADNTARVWDASTGEAVGLPLLLQDSALIAFSLDGRAVAASSGNTVRIWDTATGRPIAVPLEHQHPFIYHAAFSLDGRRLITASGDGRARQQGAVHLWDVSTGQRIGEPLQHQWVVDPAISPDGRRVVTVPSDRTARIVDATTGRPVGAPLQHQDEITGVVFSPDGRRIVTRSGVVESFNSPRRGVGRIWDASSGSPVGAPLQHQAIVTAAAFSPDGRRVVTASADNTVGVWDASTGQPVGLPLQHRGAVNAAAFSPDGRRVVTASADNTAHVWQVLLDFNGRGDLLADLAEVVGSYRLTDEGSAVPLEKPERLQRIRRLVGPDAGAFVPLEVLLGHFLDARR